MARSVVGVLVSSHVGRGEGLRAKLVMETLNHLDGDVLVVRHVEVHRRTLGPTQLWRGVNKWQLLWLCGKVWAVARGEVRQEPSATTIYITRSQEKGG